MTLLTLSLSLQLDLTKSGGSMCNTQSIGKRNSIEISLFRIDTIFIKLKRVHSFLEDGGKVVERVRRDVCDREKG